MWLVYKRLAEAVPELAGTDDGYDNELPPEEAPVMIAEKRKLFFSFVFSVWLVH